MASSRVEWDYSYQKLLQEGTIPIWKEVDHLRQIYRFGHNHYLRQVIDRVHSRCYRGFSRGSLWATDIGIIDHSVSLLRDEGMVTGKHNKDYIGGAKKLIQYVFRGQTQPNSLEYTDFMDKVNSMSKIEDLIPLYFHPLNFTGGERLMFPIAALVRLNLQKTVDVNGKNILWTVAYGQYCARNSYEYVPLGPNLIRFMFITNLLIFAPFFNLILVRVQRLIILCVGILHPLLTISTVSNFLVSFHCIIGLLPDRPLYI